MKPSDLTAFRSVGDPQLHPDGERIAFVVSRMDLEEDTYVREIWLWDGEQARPFTHGPSDGSPRWSPDGEHLAFVRKGEKKEDKPQVVVMPADGGEARRLTDFPLGAREIAWAPDSRRLAVVGAEWIADLADLDDEERARRPKRITEIPYRADDQGFIHDRRAHIHVVDALDPDAEVLQVTDGPYDEGGITWRPDGRAIVFQSRRHDTRETDPNAGVYEVDLDSDDVREVLAPGMWGSTSFARDGALLVTGLPDAFLWPTPTRVYRYDGEGEPVDLTTDLDRDCGAPTVGPIDTDRGVLVMSEDRGRARVVALGDGSHAELVGGDRTVSGFSASPDGERIAFTADAPGDPGELYLWTDGTERVLTDLNATFRDEHVSTATEHFTFERDGAEIDAWALVPEGDDVPLLLNIHGGPTAQYGFTFFDEFQVYADAGYAVVGINPRGSSGRGEDWSRAVVGAWTEHESVDMLDLRAAVDAMLERYPSVSRERIGIMGGSYGGYATARILAQDDRFRSAVVERGLLVWPSFSGTSDIAAYFDRMFLGCTLPDGLAEMWTASPVSTAHLISAPTLLLHSESDLRCPIEQAEQLFTRLRLQGVEAELLRFPNESHELSRSGAPKHRVERFEAILAWHDRHLDVERPEEETEEVGDSDEPPSAATAPTPQVPAAG